MFFHISQSLKDKQRVASQTFSSTFSLGQTAAALRLSHTHYTGISLFIRYSKPMEKFPLYSRFFNCQIYFSARIIICM